MLQTCHAHNEMLSHNNCIVIGCFKDIFQTADTNNLPAVLQGLKELNFILANRAPQLSAHYGFPLEPQQVSAQEVPDFVSVYLHRPLPTQPNIAVEEDQGPKATNITDPQDSLDQYQGITGKQTGQMHTLILTELELLISLDIVTGIGVSHNHHLDTNICITKLVILNIIPVIYLICIP